MEVDQVYRLETTNFTNLLAEGDATVGKVDVLIEKS